MDFLRHQIVFYLFGIIPVRDTVVMTWILNILIIVSMLIIKKIFPNLLDTILEFLTSLADDILDVDNLNPYLPILGSLFIFLFFANTLSIVPGLKSPTSDVNTTLALAIIVFFAVHSYGIWNKGFWGYLRTVANPIYLLPLEIISQISRTLSLTLRLFGNIMSSEIIVTIVFSIIPLIAPIPFIALGLFTGFLQAYILTSLATLYIAFAIEINLDNGRTKINGAEKNLIERKETNDGKS